MDGDSKREADPDDDNNNQPIRAHGMDCNKPSTAGEWPRTEVWRYSRYSHRQSKRQSCCRGLNQAWSCFKVVLLGSGTRIKWPKYHRYRRMEPETEEERLQMFPGIGYSGVSPAEWSAESETR